MLELRIKEHQKEFLIKGAAGIATLLVGFLVMIHPANLKIASLRSGVELARQRVEIFKESKALNKSLIEMEDSLASLSDRSAVLSQISALLIQNKISVQTLIPKTVPEGDYLRWNVDVDGKGSFFSLIQFLKALEMIDPVISVKQVSVLRTNIEQHEGAPGNLQIRLGLETYLKQRKKKKDA